MVTNDHVEAQVLIAPALILDVTSIAILQDQTWR
jgi:hypothetical protein